MKRRLTLLMFCGLMLGGAACLVDMDAVSVEIQRALAPTAACTYEAGNLAQPYGIYDVNLDFISGGPEGYVLALLVRNNMEQAATDTEQMGTIPNIRDQATNAEIVGLEGCWYQYQGVVQEMGNYQTGQIVDCATIPKQSGSIPVGQEVDAGQGQGIVMAEVLTPAMLASIFGSGFNMAAVLANPNNYTKPHVVGDPGNQNALLSSVFLNSLAAPSNTVTRDPNWGPNYPTTLNAPLIVQLRAVYAKQSGTTGHSNWFSYLINYCPTCLSNPCGYNTFVICPNTTCVDGTGCGTGAPVTTTNPPMQTCTNGDVCSNIIAKEFNVAKYTNACLPAQDDAGTNITCNVVNACPAIN